jgi:hypothetical protein
VTAARHFLLTCAGAALAVGAFATTSQAQPHYHARVGVPYVSAGFYWGGYYDPWWCCAYYPPPYYGAYLPPDASVKLEVKPNQAEVYVDGYYAGIVDDFDGAFQRLRVDPGEHEIELYLDGYRAVKQKIFLSANNTFKVKYAMQKLGAGEQAEPRPNPPTPPPSAQSAPPMQQEPPPSYPQRSPMRRPPAPPPPPPPEGGSTVRAGQSGYGSVSIRVQPADAEVSIDGEAWRSPQGQERLVVEVSEGSHTIEVRKSGYRTYVTQVDVRRGDTMPLNVSLRGEQQ